jgi:hypothetical protein
VPSWFLADELRLEQQVRIQGTHQWIHLMRTPFDSAGFADLASRLQRTRFL